MVPIRPSVLDDAPGIAACVDAVARERRYLLHVQGFTVDDTRTYLASLESSGGVQFVAVDDSHIVGWCDVTPLAYEGIRHVGRLGIGLLPAYRQQGIGRRLLEAVITGVFAGNTMRIELEVFASNGPAIRLYERLGFATEGRKRLARALDGVVEDIVIMGLLRHEWKSSEPRP